MSGTAEPTPPNGDPRRDPGHSPGRPAGQLPIDEPGRSDRQADPPAAPYPGWSVQQPEPHGWGEPRDESQQSSQSADLSRKGWSAGSNPVWGPPDAKPGVIPLRPLGVGEILDGAVTTIRRNLGAMLGLSAVVAVVTQLISTASIVWLFGDRVTEPNFGIRRGNEAVKQLEDLAADIPTLLVSSFVTLLATVFLTGVLTVVVGRAVLGRQLTIRQAWDESKNRLIRLVVLTFAFALIWLSPILGLLVIAVLLSMTGVTLVLLVVPLMAAVPASIWLYVRFSLSLPALMLETSTGNNRSTHRPIRVVEALRRSAALVRGSWWRVFGILLLILFIVWVIGQVVAVPFGVPNLLRGGFDGRVLMWSILNTAAGIIVATITAPFSAAATALLYIDRRIRREGLDIDLARAAHVELPDGRSASPPGES
jgi:hypothetical protein